MASDKEEGEKRQKGWYRYKLLFGATRTGGHYECELMLQKRGKTKLEDFPREEAENILSCFVLALQNMKCNTLR